MKEEATVFVSHLSAGIPGLIERIGEVLALGGPVAAILAALSVAALGIILAKLWQFRTARIGDLRLAREAIALHRSGNTPGALALARSSSNPAAGALAHALHGQERGIAEDAVREEVERYGNDVLEALRVGFRPLEIIASLSPLLGLFGTVLGMIEAFREFERGGIQVNPAALSGGIWEALLTTALGLGVAIPVVAALGWLERRVERLAHEMGSIVTRAFTVDLSGHDEEEVRVAPSRMPPRAAVAER